MHAHAVAYPAYGARGLSENQARQVMADGIAALQAQRSTSTKADLVGSIGERLPACAGSASA